MVPMIPDGREIRPTKGRSEGTNNTQPETETKREGIGIERETDRDRKERIVQTKRDRERA